MSGRALRGQVGGGEVRATHGHHGHCLHVELEVALEHHLLEGEEVVHREDLVEHELVERRRVLVLAHLDELLGRDAHLRQKALEQRVDHVAELAVDRGVLELVLLLVVEDDALLVDELHHRHRPLRRLEEAHDAARACATEPSDMSEGATEQRTVNGAAAVAHLS